MVRTETFYIWGPATPFVMGHNRQHSGQMSQNIQSFVNDVSVLKGKLAHNCMTSHLVFISCLLDMIKRSITEKNDIICCYRDKKIKVWTPYILGFPISPLPTSLKGEFPLNKKECL